MASYVLEGEGREKAVAKVINEILHYRTTFTNKFLSKERLTRTPNVPFQTKIKRSSNIETEISVANMFTTKMIRNSKSIYDLCCSFIHVFALSEGFSCRS